MLKKIIKIFVLSSFFIFSSSLFAQDDNIVALGGLQNILDQINLNLKDFLKRYTDFNGITMQDQNYVGPKMDPQELNQIKEPARSMILSMQFPQNSSIYNTILQAGNVSNNPIIDANTQSLSIDALQDIFTILDLDVCPSGITNCKLRNNTLADIATIPVSSPYATSGDRIGFITPDSYTQALSKLNPYNKSLDVNTLLGPLAYAPPQQSENDGSPQASQDTQMALNFIKLITEQSIPISLKGALTGDKNKDNAYIARLRGYASQMSIDVSNYYQILARRIKRPIDGKIQSQWEMEQNLATRRLNSDWHDQMEKAPPAIIQREILYLLAEINYQLYQSRIEQERLLATVTAQHALTLQTTVKPGFYQPGPTPPPPMQTLQPPR